MSDETNFITKCLQLEKKLKKTKTLLKNQYEKYCEDIDFINIPYYEDEADKRTHYGLHVVLIQKKDKKYETFDLNKESIDIYKTINVLYPENDRDLLFRVSVSVTD